VPVDALVERLRRRVAALERQLGVRIEEVASLRAQLAEAHRLLGDSREAEARAWREVEQWKTEHEALMNTLTMRALRRPREWYGAARRRLARP
jgi:chromosome segregation ATPase